MFKALAQLLAGFFAKAPSESSAQPTKKAPDLDLAGKLILAMQENGHDFSDEPGHVTILYVEGAGPDGTKNDDKPNVFNDARFAIRFENGKPVIAGAWEATTEPSLFWTKNPMNAKGAARIKFGQYTAWRVGIHNGSHEALVQTGGPVTVCRDLNKDFERDGDKEDTGYFGINQHWGYDLPKGDMGRSSAGCLVGRRKTGHVEFMKIVKSDPRYKEDSAFVFTATILPAEAV